MDTSEKMGDLQAQQQQTNGGTSKQIVHVRGDSETELDLLFSVLNSRDQKPPTRSFRDMNLPLSFFRPPDPKPAGCHSREGSLDGAGVQYTGGTSHPSHGGPMASMPNVFHSRSHSSPAQLPLSLSVAPQMPSGQQQHMKHESADAGGVDGGLHHQQSSWTNGTLAQNVSNKFFMSAAKGVWPQQQQVADSHGKGRTTSVASSPNKQTGGGVLLQNGQNGHQGAPAVVVPPSSHNLGPLPHGWEQGVTPEGDIYYINHIEKTTSWFDPRIPKHLQKSVPVKATSIRGSGSIVGTAVQHKQPAQPNHVVAATPVAVTSPQRPPSGAVSSLQSVVVNRPPVVSSVSHPSHEQLLRHELQKLQKEKERLRREQEEAVRREKLLMNELAKMKQLQAVSISSSSTAPAANAGTVSGSGGEHSSSSSQMMMMQQMVNSGVDPFLGQSVVPGATAPSSIESHSVQTTVTADAGHASAGATGFSLVRNPEEFFGSIDNMDTNDVHKTTGASRVQQQQQQPSNMSGLQQCMPAIDVPLLADSSDQLGMDSDDLVPTLTDDITMDVQMMENIIQYI